MIGLGTYAFFWQHSDKTNTPLSLTDMLQRTHDLGGGVFQICDYRPVLDYDPAQLQRLKRTADDLGIILELGTKGIRHDHLSGYLRVAEALGVNVIRSMVTAPDHRPTLAEAEQLLRAQLPAFAAADVTIALETYEQLSSRDLVTLIETLGSDRVGICLDPANCVAALEHPLNVIARCAPYVKNLHVKDFAFTRRGGWVGFTLEGTELGKGLLPYDEMIRAVRPEARGIHRIVEHWLTWQDDFEKTVTAENRWNAYNLAFMRERDKALGKQ